MTGTFNPTSPVLIITVDTNHKTKENESKQYNSQDGICFSGISTDNVAALTKYRREIFPLLKENKIHWPEDENELFINQSLRNGKDFFGNDEDAQYLPAISRLIGGVFGAMGERRKELIQTSAHHFLVVSAAYGLLTPFEPIQYYSCQFGDYNATYDIWTRQNQISELLIDYIQKHGIKRIFDFTYCSTFAYHECFDWSLISKKTGSDIFHAYHRWGKGDAALIFFGSFIRDRIIPAATNDLMAMQPDTWYSDHTFTVERRKFERKPRSEDEEFAELLKNGETENVEFKSRACWSLDSVRPVPEKPPSPEEKKYGVQASKFIIAKTIAAFLNTDGGNLVIGLLENKNDQVKDHILGIERDYIYLEDRCVDGYQRMIIDSILKPYFDRDFFYQFSKFVSFAFKKVNDKTLCWIKIKKADNPIFITSGKEDMFFIRTGPETRELKGKKETWNYISRHFHR